MCLTDTTISGAGRPGHISQRCHICLRKKGKEDEDIQNEARNAKNIKPFLAILRIELIFT